VKLRFWKKTSGDEAAEPDGTDEKSLAELQEKEAQQGPTSGIWADLSRVRAKVESLDEIRKANAERFAHISEQVGELRGMILDTNRSVSQIEVKITKTNDLVEAVQPDKLMVEVRKTEGKIEAVRANIESNEAMMKTLMSELKDLRNKVSFFRGLEQVVKLNEDIKKELTAIQKTKAVVERHADKSETIFSEMQNRFAEMDKFTGIMKDLQSGVKLLNDATDTLKIQIVKKTDKQELEKLIKKFNEFEVHVGNVIDLMSRKAKELNEQFKADVEKFHEMFDLELKKGKGVLELIEDLSASNPNLEKNLQLVKEIEHKEEQQRNLEKIAQAAPAENPKKAWFSWMKKVRAKEEPRKT
jgi:RNAse (barnase) inhibitor barstar